MMMTERPGRARCDRDLAAYLDSVSAYGTAAVPPGRVFVDDALDEAFRRDGYVVAPLLTAEDVAALLALHREVNPNQKNEFDTTIFHEDPEYRTRIREQIDAIVQPRALPMLDRYRRAVSNFINKKGETTGARVWMHQDYTFVDQSRHVGVHVWIPLVDVDEANGCMSAYPGTHDYVNHISAQPLRDHKTYPWPYRDIHPLMGRGAGVLCPMPAGYGLFFNERTLHSSGENTTPHERPVVNCAYVPEDEPIYLFSPTPDKDGVLDMLAMPDITNYHIRHGQPLPHPYPDFMEKVGEVVYTPTFFTREQVLPLMRADFVPFDGDNDRDSIGPAKWVKGGSAVDAHGGQPEDAAAPSAPPSLAGNRSWLGRLLGKH